MGGTPQRMENFAYFIMKEIGYSIPTGTALKNISKLSHRCVYLVRYKIAGVLWSTGQLTTWLYRSDTKIRNTK